jgi:hypothetical protein
VDACPNKAGLWQACAPIQGLSKVKTLQFPGVSILPKTDRFYAGADNVASERNACGKFFTGMIRSPFA